MRLKKYVHDYVHRFILVVEILGSHNSREDNEKQIDSHPENGYNVHLNREIHVNRIEKEQLEHTGKSYNDGIEP